MSPVVVTELAVQVDGGAVTVRRERERVRVTWFCGDSRVFAVEDLRATVNNVDKLRPHGDVWLSTKDTDGRGMALCVRDGALIADNGPREAGGRSVPWDELKKALRRAME